MKHFVERADLGLPMLLSECLDWIDQNDPARVIDVFANGLDVAEKPYSRSVPKSLRRALIIVTFACLLLPSLARAMEIRVAGDQLILSGPVVAHDYDEVAVSGEMKKQVIELKVGLGIGRGSDRVLTCDLTKDYVAINGDYRS